MSHADAGSIFIRQHENLRFGYVHNDTLFSGKGVGEALYADFSIPVDDHSIVGYAALTGETLVIDDACRISADRNYLEKLVLLFEEFEEAGIPGFHSEEEFIEKTEGFYKNLARKRLWRDMAVIAQNMRHHFRVRWDIDRHLYAEAIVNNIGYLKSIVGGGGPGESPAIVST